MKRTLAIAFIISFFVIFPSRLLAKGATTKIMVEGADLAKPIEITDQKVLANFNVWTGPGTSSNSPGFNANAPGFIIDWSQGPVGETPKTLRAYQVSFYEGAPPNEHTFYVVYYQFSPGADQGYVYLPGESDKWCSLNVRSIFRGVEGKWFRAWSTWERVARPLIEKARVDYSEESFGACATTPPPNPPFVPPSPYWQDAGEGGFWYGTESLWTLLSVQGTWNMHGNVLENKGGYRTKLTYWRRGLDWRTAPELIVTARRLNREAPTVASDGANNAFVPDPVMMTAIDIPTAGCWKITAQYRSQKLSFVVSVQP